MPRFIYGSSYGDLQDRGMAFDAARDRRYLESINASLRARQQMDDEAYRAANMANAIAQRNQALQQQGQERFYSQALRLQQLKQQEAYNQARARQAAENAAATARWRGDLVKGQEQRALDAMTRARMRDEVARQGLDIRRDIGMGQLELGSERNALARILGEERVAQGWENLDLQGERLDLGWQQAEDLQDYRDALLKSKATAESSKLPQGTLAYIRHLAALKQEDKDMSESAARLATLMNEKRKVDQDLMLLQNLEPTVKEKTSDYDTFRFGFGRSETAARKKAMDELMKQYDPYLPAGARAAGDTFSQRSRLYLDAMQSRSDELERMIAGQAKKGGDAFVGFNPKTGRFESEFTPQILPPALSPGLPFPIGGGNAALTTPPSQTAQPVRFPLSNPETAGGAAAPVTASAARARLNAGAIRRIKAGLSEAEVVEQARRKLAADPRTAEEVYQRALDYGVELW